MSEYERLVLLAKLRWEILDRSLALLAVSYKIWQETPWLYIKFIVITAGKPELIRCYKGDAGLMDVRAGAITWTPPTLIKDNHIDAKIRFDQLMET